MIHSNKDGKHDSCNCSYCNNAVPARSPADDCNEGDSYKYYRNRIHYGLVAFCHYHACKFGCYIRACCCKVVDVHLKASGRLRAFENRSEVVDRVAFAGLPVLPAQVVFVVAEALADLLAAAARVDAAD